MVSLEGKIQHITSVVSALIIYLTICVIDQRDVKFW